MRRCWRIARIPHPRNWLLPLRSTQLRVSVACGTGSVCWRQSAHLQKAHQTSRQIGVSRRRLTHRR
uniref:Secreted protein n=1 Tax=Mesocestoides corti TaxID=53468 RepID=A0A5K3FT07_MESCO